MSDTSGQPGTSAAPKAKPEGSELLDEGSKDVFFDLESSSSEDEGTTSYSTSNSLSDICEQGFQQQAQIHKLKKMLKSKSHEQDNMAQQAAETRKKLEEEQTRADSMEQQLQRACEEKQQSKDLLADTQVIRRSLESRLDKLREKKKWAEQCNTQLESKLQQTLIQCKQLDEKCAHSGELLDMKQIDFDRITKRYNALESDFEAMVLEKEVQIHELKGSLELAQNRCQQLEPENLNSHMEETLAELNSLDDLLLKNNMSRLGLSRADRSGQLNEELPRAVGSPQSLTDDLQKQLEERNKELLLLREQEQEALRTVATLSDEKTRLQLRLVHMEKEWGAVKQNLATTYSQLQQKINPLIAERDALRDRRQKADSQLKSIQLDMLQLSEDNKHLKQECDRLKEDNWRMSTKRETADALRLELDRHQGLLVAAQTEVDRLTQPHAETSHEKDVLSYELQQQREQFAKLKQSLQSVELNAEQQAKRLVSEKKSLQGELQQLQSELQQLQAKCEPEKCSSCAEKLAEIRSAEIQMSRLQKFNKRQAKILSEHYVDVDKAKLFDVELQLDDSLTLQSLCAGTPTVDISNTQQNLLTALKGNAEQFKAFIKQQEKQVKPEKQGASSDATNMKHLG
ncbi:putative leucine-rich repeat-containing protein DDB_G0290503 [Drosophila obscura]|uniref:putative leucine-rich repeat-containing protein DDB_G0290503 n=1 Tax=Drosophila obscura TaxID=7282 RepID=UPI001BB1DB30|nr:putative leucine-rich repeat-containing protein DDB_G0290503 [Drosophila obscura]